MSGGMVNPSRRSWRVAIELSVLAHLLLAILLPQANAALLSLVPLRPTPPATPQDENQPLRFELVELPDQREEEPSRPDAPASDLSRRAHGGQGEPDTRPGVQGTTPELRLAPAQPGAEPVPGGASSVPEPSREQTEDVIRRDDAGAGAILVQPEPEPTAAAPVLRGVAPRSGPPAIGGAIPDRRGGRVDLGPLSFDTEWYDWGPYAAEMLRRIRYHWRIPELARLGVPGSVRIRFTIERDGRVSGLEIQRESEHPPMTFAARDAILNASPLPPLPADLTGVEREGVTITFFYNMRPPDDY
jgi:protein TonB